MGADAALKDTNGHTANDIARQWNSQLTPYFQAQNKLPDPVVSVTTHSEVNLTHLMQARDRSDEDNRRRAEQERRSAEEQRQRTRDDEDRRRDQQERDRRENERRIQAEQEQRRRREETERNEQIQRERERQRTYEIMRQREQSAGGYSSGFFGGSSYRPLTPHITVGPGQPWCTSVSNYLLSWR